MSEKEKAALERRIYDRCLVRVGQLEAEKAALERRIDELCAENEQMRKTAMMLANARTNLLAENAKLRELADKLSILADCECEGCLHVDNCPLMAYGDECPVSLEVKLLKRELGIEVDNGTE